MRLMLPQQISWRFGGTTLQERGIKELEGCYNFSFTHFSYDSEKGMVETSKRVWLNILIGLMVQT